MSRETILFMRRSLNLSVVTVASASPGHPESLHDSTSTPLLYFAADQQTRPPCRVLKVYFILYIYGFILIDCSWNAEMGG
jgi:hypothetical protein